MKNKNLFCQSIVMISNINQRFLSYGNYFANVYRNINKIIISKFCIFIITYLNQNFFYKENFDKQYIGIIYLVMK